MKEQLKNILIKTFDSNVILLIVFTVVAVLFSELLVYLQLNTFWHDKQNHEMVYYVGFWTPLFDAFIVVFIVILIKNYYKQNLEEKKEELDIYYNAMLDAVAIADVDTKRLLNCNKAFEELTGYTKDELQKLTIDKLHPQDSLPYVIEQFERQAKGETQIAPSIPVLHKNGLVTMCDIGTRFYEAKNKKINIGVFKNITDRLMLEEELKELNKNLENRVKEEVKKNRVKDQQMLDQSRQAQMGEMISMIAHQWRQPLGAISATSANLELKFELEAFDLDTKEGQEKQATYFLEQLNHLDGFVHNLTTTIDDFRNFYKPNKKPNKITFEELIEKSLRIIKASLINNNIEIVYNYNSNEVLELHDSEMIQVILNIFKNAQDNFIEKETENPKIIITTKEKILSICDNGGGVSEDIIEKIFDPYFSTKDEKNGTGLGLHMSKTIVQEHHNGKLTAYNRDGGVCFSIDLSVNS